jgi:hypothetical protein
MTLSAGKLATAQMVYQRYYERYSARLDWVVQQVEPLVKNETFTGDDEIEIDRKDSPWPADMSSGRPAVGALSEKRHPGIAIGRQAHRQHRRYPHPPFSDPKGSPGQAIAHG